MNGKLKRNLKIKQSKFKNDIEKLKDDLNDFQSFFFDQNKGIRGEYKVDTN